MIRQVTPAPGAPTTLLTLPRLAVATARAVTSLAQPRRGLALAAPAGRITLSLCPACPAAPGAAVFAARLDGAPIRLAVAPVDLRRALDPALAAAPDHPLAALAIEAALAPWLDAWELASGLALALDPSAPPPDPRLATQAVLRIDAPGAPPGRLALTLAPETAERLAAVFDPDPGAGQAMIDALPIPARIVLGAVRLDLGTLVSLVPGDGFVLDALGALPPRQALLVFDHRPGFTIGLSPDHARVIGPAPAHSPGDTAMDAPEPFESPGSLEDIPIRLSFELGRIELGLRDLRALGPGTVLPLSRPLAELVEITANGRRIGMGRLVEVGAGVAVQIVRLDGHD